jgi:hypothetical protein
MTFPAKGTRYDLNPEEHAIVSLKDDGKFEVRIVILRQGRGGFASMIRTKDKLTFDSMDQVKKYLFEYADEDHKDQFRK